jgi:formate hydrogenlyase transcriptional activator
MEGTAAVTGKNFFASLVQHLASALRVRYAFITECRERPHRKARTLAFWQGDRLGDKVTYEIAETPCLKVLEGDTCYYPSGVQQLFPRDTDLVAMSAEGYLGIPLRAASGEVIGHLAVIDDKPMVETPQGLSMLNIFAARAGAELERQHAEEELRLALAEVERLKNQLHAENLYLQEEIRRDHNFDEIVGSSPALLETLRQVERVAPTDSTIIIYGETGTGKELIARAIHDRSARRARPLVKVNCGAISAGLVESELFGHLKGAFTGAIDRRVGRFELADGGTLFLDEVSELPMETQVKLLRVLQEGEFEPVGSSKTVRVNVRIIAATNRKLEDEVWAGRFRADLYYRLNVLPLNVPPLRERRSDVPQIVAFFLARYAKKFGKHLDGVSQKTMELLGEYAWPGNIRELQNIIERGVALAHGPVLNLDHDLLPNDKVEERPNVITVKRSVVGLPHTHSRSFQASGSLEEMQRQHILGVLKQTGGVIEGPNGAALILNLHPNTLRSRMKKLGIQRSHYTAQPAGGKERR